MKILIAPDSYKGCLSSNEVAQAAAQAIKQIRKDVEIVTVPIADGGEGTVEALKTALNGKTVKAKVSDPLGRPIEAEYCIAGDLAVIEVAAACGLTLLKEEERNPLKTSTRGVGELILDAIDRGCHRFLVGLGGSATNDGGKGMVEVPGFKERTAVCMFTIACDVTTSFLDATKVFGPQKGAWPEDIPVLEARMNGWAQEILKETGVDVTVIPGSGAAGGLGGAFAAFLGGRLVPGIEMVLEAVGFDELLKGVDLVITGEGRSDFQTAKGKTPWGVLDHSDRLHIPTVLLSGSILPCPEFARFHRCIAVTPEGQPLSEALRPEVAFMNIQNALKNLFNE